MPAWVCETEPQTGAIRVTEEQAVLPADTSQSELCPTICLACSDDEATDDEDPAVAGQEEVDTQLGSAASVLAAKTAAFRHGALAPQGAPPVPDPRLLEWVIPETCKPERRVCLAYSTTKMARLTYLAQAWREPRSFTARYHTLLAGLSAQERRARLDRVADAIAHPAIPEEERHHLYVNIHHGHWQGVNKCKGDQRYCATCLRATGVRHEETVMHVAHACPTARALSLIHISEPTRPY